jgi:hypothetical protein
MLDWRPDLDPRTPGILTLVSEMLPEPNGGYYTVHSECTFGPDPNGYVYVPIAGETFPNAYFGSRWNSIPGGILLVGTNKRISVPDLSGGNGFVNVSRPGDYALGTLPYQYPEDAYGFFDFCAFGDIIVACNRGVTAQKRSALDLSGGTLFSDLGNPVWTAAPGARVCCVANNFVFLGDVGNFSTVTGARDILAWSAIGDHTDWRINPQVTQCSFAQFVDTPGGITAVTEFQNGIVVFKGHSMYRGRYVGAGPNSPIWDFERISDNIGCIGPRSFTTIDQGIVFVGDEDIFLYDGTRPRSITTGIRRWLAANYMFVGNNAGQYPLLLGHFRTGDLVYMCGFTKMLGWNYRLDKWGALSTTMTAQAIPCRTNTIHFRTNQVIGVTNGQEQIQTNPEAVNVDIGYIVNGATKNRNKEQWGNSYMITGYVGQPDRLSTLSRVTPIMPLAPQNPVTVPPTLELTWYGSPSPGQGRQIGTANYNSKYRFDTLGGNPNQVVTASSYEFFSFRLDIHNQAINATVGIVDIVPKLTPAGER